MRGATAGGERPRSCARLGAEAPDSFPPRGRCAEKEGMKGKLRSLGSGVVFVSALCAASARLAPRADDEAKAEPVKFKRAAWKAGDTIRSKLDVDEKLSVSMSVKGDVVQQFDQIDRESTHKKNVLLAVDEDGPTKVAVHYGDVVAIQETAGSNDPDAKTTSPIAGKSYVVETSSKGVTITDEDGAAVTGDIAALVREKELSRDESLEHGFDRLAALVAESSRRPGRKFEVPSDLALEIAGADEDLKDARMTLELKEVRDEDGTACGVFAVDLRVWGSADGGEYKTTVALEGELLIRIEGARFVSTSLAGTVTIDGEVSTGDTTVSISGEGPLKITATASYGHEDR